MISSTSEPVAPSRSGGDEEGTEADGNSGLVTLPATEHVQGKVGGAWVFRGCRLPVATVIENLEDLSVEEVMEQFDVTREQIVAVLDFVARSLREPEPADVDSF
jgi:uncharacterized protein (DUF433 family)